MPANAPDDVASNDLARNDLAKNRIIPQDWDRYTPGEHALWDRLFARQAGQLTDRVVPEFLAGLDVLRMTRPGIPRFEDVSERLMKATGWQVVAVPGLVPDHVFFDHLANRRFVAGRFIRRPDQIDYLEEPDVFHDVFGHVPLLAHPVFADFMQAYGQGGMRADGLGAIARLARLYWYTVECGLIGQPEGLRPYSAGVLSSLANASMKYAVKRPIGYHSIWCAPRGRAARSIPTRPTTLSSTALRNCLNLPHQTSRRCAPR